MRQKKWIRWQFCQISSLDDTVVREWPWHLSAETDRHRSTTWSKDAVVDLLIAPVSLCGPSGRRSLRTGVLGRGDRQELIARLDAAPGGATAIIEARNSASNRALEQSSVPPPHRRSNSALSPKG